MFLMDIVIIYFIKYEFDEFELNWMNVYVWYDVLSMFVNDVVCDIFRKGDTRVEMIRMCIVWRFDLSKEVS